jgi:NADH:ubiquinone oxidoreductase subunit F (NADH-binding)
MTQVWRVLDRAPCPNLDAYRATGGGGGLQAAVKLGPAAVIEEIAASGLRGRGGGGFPTGRKWTTVAEARSPGYPTTVVVNAAEGEPATFKDRALLRRNPFKVLEGALIAAFAMGANSVVVGLKASASREHRRLRRAMAEVQAAGWADGLELRLVLGPDAYLFGEETALLEVIEGRQPLPRVTPPYRRGLEDDDTRSAGGVALAVPGGGDEPPALVDNVETLANVPAIVAEGADWYRSLGTERSPGTIICTLVGDTLRHGVAEFEMGTPVAEMVGRIGQGPRPGRRLESLLPGVAGPLLPAHLFDTPLTYEDLEAVGSSLGSAGFTAFDEQVDPVAIAHGVARFLAVESCGQCEPCKRDGLALAEDLDTIRRNAATADDVSAVSDRLSTVTDGARCFLAYQQERVIGSVLRLWPDQLAAHAERRVAPSAPVLIAPLVDLAEGQARYDERHARKQPDWSYDEIDSGAWPAARLGDTPVEISAPSATVPSVERSSDAPQGADSAVSDAAATEATAGRGVAPLAQSYARLRQLLQVLGDSGLPAERDGEPGSAEWTAVWEDLDHELRVHHDANRRVLLPMLRRVGGESGERAADDAESNELEAIRLVERMADPHASGDDASGDKDAAELRQLLDDEESTLTRLLETNMDQGDLDRLGLALVEARYTTVSEAELADS